MGSPQPFFRRALAVAMAAALPAALLSMATVSSASADPANPTPVSSTALPTAQVNGVVWSQFNHDFHGRDRAVERTLDPYRGVTWALDAGGITYLPVHAEDIAGAAGKVKVLIGPQFDLSYLKSWPKDAGTEEARRIIRERLWVMMQSGLPIAPTVEDATRPAPERATV